MSLTHLYCHTTSPCVLYAIASTGSKTRPPHRLMCQLCVREAGCAMIGRLRANAWCRASKNSNGAVRTIDSLLPATVATRTHYQ